MRTVCETNLCDGCKACLEVCPQKAIAVTEQLEAYNAFIVESLCIKCDACRKICQRNYPAEALKPVKWYQGWAEDDKIRMNSSSGGAASALIRAFMKMNGSVCSCIFEGGRFRFRFVSSINELEKFAGSKYVKSDPHGVYKQISQKLKAGEKVLFIGLPCQVSALKKYTADQNTTNLYTVDLICHGTPSPELLERFLNQYGLQLDNLEDIKFRRKMHFQTYRTSKKEYKGIVAEGILDCYLMGFLNSLFYTENCYHCNYAKLERVADITLGDSWGSMLPAEEVEKGISLILCQTSKGMKLAETSGLCLKEVELGVAVKNNKQLRESSQKPVSREIFFEGISSKRRFNALIRKCYPKQYCRQKIKELLIKLHLVGGVH